MQMQLKLSNIEEDSKVMEEVINQNTLDIKEIKEQQKDLRNDMVSMKGNHTRLTKRVEEIEKKFKIEKEVKELPKITPNQMKAFFAAVLFLLYTFKD